MFSCYMFDHLSVSCKNPLGKVTQRSRDWCIGKTRYLLNGELWPGDCHTWCWQADDTSLSELASWQQSFEGNSIWISLRGDPVSPRFQNSSKAGWGRRRGKQETPCHLHFRQRWSQILMTLEEQGSKLPEYHCSFLRTSAENVFWGQVYVVLAQSLPQPLPINQAITKKEFNEESEQTYCLFK